MSRPQKRIFIIFIYLFLFGLVVGSLVWIMRTPPSCFDKKQNQNEQGIDCGGVCGQCPEVITAKNIEIIQATIMPAGEDTYDVVARIKNPNLVYGGARVPYVVTLKDEVGNDLVVRNMSTYILPTQEKYITELNFTTTERPRSAVVDVIHEGVRWVSFRDYEDPDFTVEREVLRMIEQGSIFAEAYGLVENKSPFDFATVTASVVLLDDGGKPIAVNVTEMNNFEAFTERDFTIGWPYSFSGEVDTVDVEVDVNVYDPENFITKNSPGGTFQRTQ